MTAQNRTPTRGRAPKRKRSA